MLWFFKQCPNDKGKVISDIKTRLRKIKAFLSKAAFISQYYTKKLIFQIKRRAPSLKKLHVNSFPAIHMKKMDWMDFAFKFSGEILVLVLAASVTVLNLFYFNLPGKSGFKDTSLAGNFLNKHTSLNQKLYAKNNSIVTVVSQGNPFVQQAFADDFNGLETLAATQPDTGSEIIMGDDNSILAPNPDSIQGLVNNAVKKLYTTQEGDTLGSIAKANDVSVDSIRWSNPNLVSSTIKPGWVLIIPPINGIAVTANSNTTLPDLATRYSPERYNPNKTIRAQAAAELLEKIIYYNGLDSAEDINDGDFLIIPGGVVATAPVVPTPTPKPNTKTPKVDNTLNAITSISGGYDDDTHSFPKGYCTYYVSTRTKITFGGNAKNWLANAKASGYVTGKEPAPNSVVVTTDSAKYGHVAYVEEVVGDKILVTEMNYVGFNKISQRWISVNSPTIRGYIYP